MNVWHDVRLGDGAPKIVNAIIEIPKDSKIKYEIDKETGLLKLDRFLYSSVHYSGDYGMVPQTICEDGDPLDIFVISHRPTEPMALCEVKVLGVAKMVDEGEEDDKIIGVHAKDPRYNQWEDLDQIPTHFIEELREFLRTYKRLEGKEVNVYKIHGKEEAKKIVEKSYEKYKQKFSKKQSIIKKSS